MKRIIFLFWGVWIIGGKLMAEETIELDKVPVIDMERYYNRDTRDDVIQELTRALQEVGFFAVINTGVRGDLVDRAYEAIKAFFSLNLELKEKYEASQSNRQRGYCPLGGEAARGETEADIKEFFHVGRELNDEAMRRLGYHKNIWPNEVALKVPLLRLFKELEAYMVPLQAALAQAVGVDRGYFDEMTREGDVLMRCIHYPPNPNGQDWAAAHTDIDLFTILPKATADGLEVRLKDGSWVRVTVPEDAFIINAGDMLQNLSNGYFRSAEHRVVATESGKSQSRYSIVLFVHSRDTDRLDPLPVCVERTGGVRIFPNATRRQLLLERLADLGQLNEEGLRELAESGLLEQQIELGRASEDVLKAVAEVGKD